MFISILFNFSSIKKKFRLVLTTVQDYFILLDNNCHFSLSTRAQYASTSAKNIPCIITANNHPPSHVHPTHTINFTFSLNSF